MMTRLPRAQRRAGCAGNPARWHALNGLATALLELQATIAAPAGADRALTVNLANTCAIPALAIKLTVLDKADARVLPAY